MFYRYQPVVYVTAALLCALALLGGARGAQAQAYSLGLGDPDNTHDAPIPGFVGPDGEGVPPAWGTGANTLNPFFLAWADTVVAYAPAPGVDFNFGFSGEALGPVTGDNFAIVSLGELDQADLDADVAPGSLTLGFAEPVRDFTGADFAVFENGFIAQFDTGGEGADGVFAELAYVEVSSNGVDFARFPSVSDVPGPVGAFGSLDPRQVHNLAGKHANAGGNSWGTPFDLSDLSAHPLVLSGQVDLDAITHVRLVDIPGSGDFTDSRGQPIHDPWATSGSGGADIEAVGVLSLPIDFAHWNTSHGLSKTDNSDGDRWPAFAEYALRLNPSVKDGHGALRTSVDDAGRLVFSFPRDERAADVQYVVQLRESLADPGEDWRDAATFGPLDQSVLHDPAVATFEVTADGPQASIGVWQRTHLIMDPPPGGQCFVRLLIKEVP